MIQDNIKKIADQFLNLVRLDGIHITEAYLFGSFAKKTADESSDIDICIISPALGKDLIDETVRLGMIGSRIDDRIEPHPMSPEDFSEKYNLLAHEIKTNGINLID